MRAFHHLGNPRLVFGPGRAADIPHFLVEQKCPLILTGRHFQSSPVWEELKSELAAGGWAFTSRIVSGEPSPEIIDTLSAEARQNRTNAVLAIGGGSVLDAGKAVAAMICHEGSVTEYLEGVGSRKPSGQTVPMIAVPTTAGTGSEASKNAVITQRGGYRFKKSLRHDAFIPTVALIDPELAVACPPMVSLACGMDALCQLLESYLSTGATPLTDILVRDALSRFGRGARLFTENLYGSPEEVDLRGELALAAYFSGLALANAGLGTVHGLAGPLGAICDVPHGVACGRLAAPIFRRIAQGFRGSGGSEARKRMAQAGAALHRGTGAVSEADEVERLLEKLELWSAPLPQLSAYGLTPADLDYLAAEAGNKNSPIALKPEEIRDALAEVL